MEIFNRRMGNSGTKRDVLDKTEDGTRIESERERDSVTITSSLILLTRSLDCMKIGRFDVI